MSESIASPEPDLADLYDNAPFGYLSMSPQGHIVTCNATLAAWTGHARDTLVGRKFHDLLTVGSRILYETNFAPLLTMQGSVNEFSVDLRTVNGSKIAVFATGNVRCNADGKTDLVRIACFKALERRHYEHQLVQAQLKSVEGERATQALLAMERETSILREQFIAVLGHDLRNPLASISGGLRMLQKEQPAERRQMLIGLIEASITRMGALIDNVLDFARGRLGAGIPLEYRQDIWLRPVLEHVVAELRIGMPDRIVETDFELDMPVRCDPSRISQLLSNLVANALTHGIPSEPVRVHADARSGTLTISVTNGGAPISSQAMAHLFQPFFRGETKNNAQGLGLGLHIASEIAKAHGGTLVANSTALETRFTFQMPLASN
jgi:sigma-B regulation protein RsbU (phosphoserine phosphatase)